MGDGLFPATLDEQLLFATTPVFYEDEIIGTGFFFRADPQLPCFLITAFHVFQNIYTRANKTIYAECVVEHHLATGKRVTEGYIRVRFKLADVRVHHAEDLAAVRLKEAFFESVGQKNDRLPAVPFFRSLDGANPAGCRRARNPSCLPHGPHARLSCRVLGRSPSISTPANRFHRVTPWSAFPWPPRGSPEHGHGPRRLWCTNHRQARPRQTRRPEWSHFG